MEYFWLHNYEEKMCVLVFKTAVPGGVFMISEMVYITFIPHTVVG